jgi:hypothetical protein
MVHALIKLTGTQDRSFKNSIGSIPVPKLTLNQLGKPSFWINVSLSYHIYICIYILYIIHFPQNKSFHFSKYLRAHHVGKV